MSTNDPMNDVAEFEALEVLPDGTSCKLVRGAHGIRSYLVKLPDGRPIAGAGNVRRAWEKARAWAMQQIAAGGMRPQYAGG